MEILLAVAVFAVAVAAMSLGVLLSGRKLSASCGGRSGEGAEDLGADCVCARKTADICASDDELVKLAEIGNPKRKDSFRMERESFAAGAREAPLEV